jgi:FKBP-type peptidyl-prolyl cis-trans isomerase (trigger factor)
VGDHALYEKAAELCVADILPSVLAEHAVLPLTAPHVSVHTHDGKEAHVTIEAPVYPTVTLPDYKEKAASINSGKTEVAVTEEEVTNALIHFRRERVRVEALEQGATPEAALTTSEEAAPETLPPLDDAFVTQIGFKSAADFEESVRKNLHTSKTDRARSEHRSQILKAITEETTAEVPEALVEYEIAKMEAALAEYLMQAGMTLDGYLTQNNLTREKLHTEWKPEATIRAKTQLALIEIGRRESITEDEKELNELVSSVMAKMKDADETAVRSHYATILRNEKVISFLESL